MKEKKNRAVLSLTRPISKDLACKDFKWIHLTAIEFGRDFIALLLLVLLKGKKNQKKPEGIQKVLNKQFWQDGSHKASRSVRDDPCLSVYDPRPTRSWSCATVGFLLFLRLSLSVIHNRRPWTHKFSLLKIYAKEEKNVEKKNKLKNRKWESDGSTTGI